MKKIVVIFCAFILFKSCKNELKKEVATDNFPIEISKIFEEHGGITTWKNTQILSFNKGEESHTVDLQSRKTVINTPKYSLGFDGENIWVSDTLVYKKDPKFYYNLYFYFYAMPFVLADDGIIYEKATPITFKGKSYPGYKISFKSNIGTSPDDNYFLYFDAETHQMKWLGYTVTYFSKKSTKKSNLIRYNSWEIVNGLKLPKQIIWYKKDENGMPTEPRGSSTDFTLPLVSKSKLPNSFWQKPAQN